MTPSYVSNTSLPSTSYTQDRVVIYDYESNVCEQQTIAGIVNGSCQLTIPLQLLDEQMTLEGLARVALEKIIFLGPKRIRKPIF
jgi:hypothetical protein